MEACRIKKLCHCGGVIYSKALCRYHYAISHPLKRSPITKKPVKINKVGKSGSLGRLIQQAVTVFHKWIRERDRVGDYFVCISCGLEKHAREMQAGHYINAGNNGVIRFHEDNIHSQCRECNEFKDGNQHNYRIGLIAKIGLERVEALEQMAKQPHKWDREELAGIIERYRV